MDVKNSFCIAMIYKLGKMFVNQQFLMFNYANQIREHVSVDALWKFLKGVNHFYKKLLLCKKLNHEILRNP